MHGFSSFRSRLDTRCAGRGRGGGGGSGAWVRWLQGMIRRGCIRAAAHAARPEARNFNFRAQGVRRSLGVAGTRKGAHMHASAHMRVRRHAAAYHGARLRAKCMHAAPVSHAARALRWQ